MHIKRAGFTIVIALSMVIATMVPAQALGRRALWVWDGPVDGVITFAVDHGITDLYLHSPPGFSGSPLYAPFIESAHAVGIQVFAMAGDPLWASDRAPWSEWVDEVVGFNAFDGLVFDVEPYLNSDWNTKRRNRLIQSYLAGLDEAARHAGPLQVHTAVPFWWDDPAYRVKRTALVELVLERSDGIVVMAYRDSAAGPDGILSLSQNEADLAASMDKLFAIGVETAPVGLDKVSFAEEGTAEMEIELAEVEAAYSAVPQYSGIAIHHYASYASMKN
ncbi:MAG: hypothetical protein P1T08_09025 [Acidimicrobiia bacterium]|nr:hypothetical protein [Acidimicrobiia bacterium]